MKSSVTPEFRKTLRSLPREVQALARKNYVLWRSNPSHPSIRFKPVKSGIWSARVGLAYRALGVVGGDCVVWFWIGHPSEYDRFLRS